MILFQEARNFQQPIARNVSFKVLLLLPFSSTRRSHLEFFTDSDGGHGPWWLYGDRFFLSFLLFSFFFFFNPKPKSLRYFDETPAGNKRERLEKVTREVVSGIIVGSLYGRNPYPPLLFHISIEIQTNILFSYVKISFKLKTISNFRNFRFEKETKKKKKKRKNISDTNYYPTGATFYARNNGRGSNAYT